MTRTFHASRVLGIVLCSCTINTKANLQICASLESVDPWRCAPRPRLSAEESMCKGVSVFEVVLCAAPMRTSGPAIGRQVYRVRSTVTGIRNIGACFKCYICITAQDSLTQETMIYVLCSTRGPFRGDKLLDHTRTCEI